MATEFPGTPSRRQEAIKPAQPEEFKEKGKEAKAREKKEAVGQSGAGGHEQVKGMEQMTGKVIEHHLAAMPGTVDLTAETFPPTVMRGLGLGALVGGLIGLLFGFLLFKSILVIPGWESVFSLGDFTFLVLWVMLGIAVGILFGGVGTILAAKPDYDTLSLSEQAEPEPTIQPAQKK